MLVKVSKKFVRLFVLAALIFRFAVISKSTNLRKTKSIDKREKTNVCFQPSLFRHRRATKEKEDDGSFRKVTEIVDLEIGSSYVMNCKTSSDAEIIWFKDRERLNGDRPFPDLMIYKSNILWIEYMRYNLAGSYSCIKTLPQDAIIMMIVHIRVGSDTDASSSCRYALDRTPNDSSFIEGEFAHLQCLTTDSRIEMSWEKNGQPLHLAKHISTMKSGFIFLSDVKIEDSGIYTCVARNLRIGCEKKVSAFLQINPTEEITEICGKVKANGTMSPRIAFGYNAVKGSNPWQLDQSAFCAGYGNGSLQASCTGDSGNPFVMKHNNK